MDRERFFSRLGFKLVGVSLLGLVLAWAVYGLVTGLAMPWLLYSERFAAFWQDRQEAAIQAYQTYITDYELSVQQVLENRPLSDAATVVYSVVVAEGVETSIKTQEGETWANTAYTFAVTPDAVFAPSATVVVVSDLHPIQCADGTIYLSAMPNAAWLEGLARIVGLVLAAGAFCGVMVPCILGLLRRIEALSRETGLLMAGDLGHSISAPGRDELSRLGSDIERLRLSVVERLEGERAAVGATARLVTGLSHDLRTPLTKLMGYLEILRRCQSVEEREKYLRLASEKAEQIKGMTDQLFDQAQVSGRPEALAQEPELVDGAQLLGQVLSELCGDLQREGFDAAAPVFAEDFRLYVRTEDVVRVFDNLYANLCKYADPAHPVTFSVELGPESVEAAVENRLRPAPDRRDSHGVGLPTMEELLARCGGRLEAEQRGEHFRTAVTFPRQ